jgi:hypothetical protein
MLENTKKTVNIDQHRESQDVHRDSLNETAEKADESVQPHGGISQHPS